MTDIWTTTELSTNELRLALLPGIGGRLWDVTFRDHSLLFKNPDLIGRGIDLSALTRLPTRSPQFGFPLWGGEKTWIAPDREWQDGAPFPTLDAAPYRVTSSDPSHLQMESEVCSLSGLKITRQVSLLSSRSWSITHTVTNNAPSDRFTGIWSVLMLNHPARIGLDIGASGKTVPVFGEAGGMSRSRGSFAWFDCSAPREFKLGMNNPTGRAFARMDTSPDPLWLCCTTPPRDPAATYAHGHDFEVFNSGDYPYCEAEWHAPARHLGQNDQMTFVQVFEVLTEAELFSNGDTALSEMELFSCMS